MGRIKLKPIRNIVLIITISGGYVFFAFTSLFGIKYMGKSESIVYVMFNVFFALMSLLIIFINWAQQKYKFNPYQFIFLFAPLLFIYFFIKDYSGNREILKVFQLYLIWSVVASYIGIYYAKNKHDFSDSLKYWVLLMFLLSTGTIRILLSYFFSGYTWLGSDIAGDADYQTLSYMLSFAYSLNLFFIIYKNKIKLFSFCYYTSYKLLSFILLILQILCVFMSGGRGGFVVIAFSTIVLLYYALKFNIISKSFLISLISVCFIVFMVIIPIFSKHELFSNGINRVFSYISFSGINMKKTSQRNVVYNIAISGIKEKPLLGHGIFKQFGYMGYWIYPHNLFLEILLGGGIIYFLFMLLISYVFYKRMIHLIKIDSSHVLLLSIFCKTFVSLMVSGTYLTTPLFWFLGAYVFCYPITNARLLNEVNEKHKQ